MKKLYEESDIQNIANSIRGKSGKTDTMKVSEMSGEIDGIETGGGGGDDEQLVSLIEGSITEIVNYNVNKTIEYAFASQQNLTKAILPNCTELGNYSFYYCTKLTTVDVSNALKLSYSCFRSCNSLEKLVASKATTVETDCFSTNLAIKTIDLPKCTYISYQSFVRCYSLTALILRSESPCNNSNSSNFASCYHLLGTTNSEYNPTGAKDGYIYVPSALIDEYKTATNWATFADQFRALEDYTVDGTTTGELDESKI